MGGSRWSMASAASAFPILGRCESAILFSAKHRPQMVLRFILQRGQNPGTPVSDDRLLLRMLDGVNQLLSGKRLPYTVLYDVHVLVLAYLRMHSS